MEECSSIFHEFLKQAAATPDSEVLCALEQQRFWTYQAICDRLNQISVRLLETGVTKGDRVGICMTQCRDLAVISMLSTWKIGAAVVPFNSSLPAEHKNRVVTASGIVCLLVDNATIQEQLAPEGCSNIVNVESEHSPDNLASHELVALCERDEAIVFFTSGSTGVPKGVRLSHGSIVNRFRWMWEAYPFIEGDVCCIKTSMSFVDMLWETFGPLCRNTKVIVVPTGARKDVARMMRVVEDHQVTRLVAVPSLLTAFCHLANNSPEKLQSLRLVISSGEMLSKSLLNHFSNLNKKAIVLNLYGSTEVTGDITFMEYRCSDAPFHHVHIGKTISNNVTYVVNSNMAKLEEGYVGELCVAGKNLALGYCDPENDVNKFVPNPFADEDGYPIMFRTGDLVRMEEGHLDYVGRKDRQVKVNGHRLELDGIEEILAGFPPVESVCVVIFDDNYIRSLVAYAVGSCTREELVEYAKAHLPEVSVPAVCMIKSIPVLPNGKVDRMYLEQCTDWLLEDSYEPPRTFLQIKVAQIMESVIPVIFGMSTNFFDRGGDSLSAVRLLMRLNDWFKVELNYIDLAENPTLRSLSALIKELQDSEQTSTEGKNLSHFKSDISSTFRVRHGKAKDAKAISAFVNLEFFKRETMIGSLIKIYGAEQLQKEFLVYTASYVPAILKDGMCVVCMEGEDDSMVGVALCEPMPDPDHVKEALPDTEILSVIGNFLGEMDARYCKEFMDVEISKVLNASMSTVASESPLGYHILFRMEEEILAAAKAKGYERVVSIATHAVTHDIAKLLGYEPLFSVSYEEFEDEQGRKIFMHSRDLHLEATLYVKKLT